YISQLLNANGCKATARLDAENPDSHLWGLQKVEVLEVQVRAIVIQVVAAGANLVLITRGIEKTTRALVSELKAISKEVEDSELADVAAVSAGNNNEIGKMIAMAMSKVG
ncbi:hypothetical protein J1N35_040884, partial [Gossypium stocksii]